MEREKVSLQRKRNPMLPLHVAITNGDNAIAHRLIYFGEDINAKDEFGNTPLHVAVIEENQDIIEKLVQVPRPAKIDVFNKDGHTPLYIAIDKKQDNIAELLIRSGADIKAVFIGWRDAPMEIATSSKNKGVVKRLKEKWVEQNLEDYISFRNIRNRCNIL